MLYKPEPSPINEPVNEPVEYDDVNEFIEPVVNSIESNLPSKSFVVVAIDELKEPIDVDTLELKSEYPVVPVIKICDEPETNVGTFVRLL